MGSSSLASFIGRLRRVVEPRGGGLDDAELLKRFAAERDEAAFEVLLWRYGPMVLGVCRRMLRSEQDVEDAFQATFLTLIRKAGSIARRKALGSWLHQVAYRIGLRALAKARREGIADQVRVESAVAAAECNAGEWRELLDQEVRRLPRRYRLPFVLCYLEGKTHAEAARLMACPPGTIASRLAWARERLRVRLTARGMTAPATFAGLVVCAETQAAALAVSIATALRTARVVTTGTLAGSGTIPAHVTAWSKGVVRAMFLSKLSMAATLIVASVLIGAGGVVWQRVQAGGAGPARSDEPAATPPPEKPKITRPPADRKPDAAAEVEQLERELAAAEAEYLKLERHWDQAIADYRAELGSRDQKRRQDKARLAFEAKRTSRALEMAESRYEKLTHALDTGDEGAVGSERLQKKQQEAQKQAEQLSAKLLQYEMELAATDQPSDMENLRIESMERQRALAVSRARERMEAIKRKLHPASETTGGRLQELERKVDALTRAMEDLRKALRR